MKWIWAVALGAVVMTGCRTAEPTTNPFLRTTVPPPGTGQGVVVTPGEPYAQGITPPVVTSPAPPPVTTQPVPVTPGPAAPPPMVAPPPPVTPQGERFHPPGGSYLYHQSSNARAAPPTTVAAAGTALPAQAAAPTTTSGYPVQQVGHTAIAASVPPTPPAATLRATVGNSRADPAPSQAAIQVPATATTSTLRIVGESATNATVNTSARQPPATSAAGAAPAANQPAFRVVASGSQATVGSTARGASPATVPSGSAMTISTSAGRSSSTARFVAPQAGSPVVQAAFQPAGPAAARSDFSHADDYSTLRGRLEYLASTRQWKLRYIPIDGQTDTYGGSVVLAQTPALNAFKSGDLVEVHGALSAQASGFSPHYQLHSIQPQAR